MRRLVALAPFLAAITMAWMASACAASQPAPAKPPPVDPQTRLSPKKHERPPAIIAPPPAYGNKVVMAARGGQSAL